MKKKKGRYFWLKLKEDFFEDDTIIWLEEQENGSNYVLFYLKLCAKSLKDDGRLARYVGEYLMPYDVNSLSRLTNTPADTVAVAMQLFIKIGLVETLEAGELYLTQIEEMIGTETDSAGRMRKYRARQKAIENSQENKALQCNSEVTKSNTEIEKEKELEKELQQKTNQKETATNTVTTFYTKNYDRLTPHIQQDLTKWIQELGSELVLEALERSVEAQKNYNYAKGIMKDWKKNEIKTMEEVEKQDLAHASQNKSTIKNKKIVKKETLPEWAMEDYEESNADVPYVDKSFDDRLLRLKDFRETSENQGENEKKSLQTAICKDALNIL